MEILIIKFLVWLTRGSNPDCDYRSNASTYTNSGKRSHCKINILLNLLNYAEAYNTRKLAWLIFVVQRKRKTVTGTCISGEAGDMSFATLWQTRPTGIWTPGLPEMDTQFTSQPSSSFHVQAKVNRFRVPKYSVGVLWTMLSFTQKGCATPTS